MIEVEEAMDVEIGATFSLVEEIYNSSSSAFSEKFKVRYPGMRELVDEIQNAPKGSQKIIASHNNQPAGFLFLTPEKDSHLSHTAKFSMGVLEKFQGQGVGKSLLAQMIKDKDPKIEIIYLMVRADNKSARKLYKDFEFSEVATLEKDTKIDGNYFDGILMSRSFISPVQ